MPAVILKQVAITDHSHHDPLPEDWLNVDGLVKGIITKITEGKDFIDWTCQATLDVAQRLGLPRGVFHFFHQNDVAPQAEFFLQVCRDFGYLKDGKWQLEIAPVLDLELAQRLSTDKTGTELAYQVKTWLDIVEKATGIRPIIYTGKGYWEYVCSPIYWTSYMDNGIKKWAWMTTANSTAPAWTADYLFWVAWTTDPDSNVNNIPWLPSDRLPRGVKNTKVVWWQYTDELRLDGIDSYIDGNKFNGTLAEWSEFVLTGRMPEVENEEGDDMTTIYHGTVLANSLYIRDAPSGNALATSLKAGDVVTAGVPVSGWWPLKTITRAGVNIPLPASPTGNCYSSSSGTQGTYIRLDSVEVLPDVIVLSGNLTFDVDGRKFAPAGGNPVTFAETV